MKRSISNAEKRQAGRRACVRVCVLYRLGGLLLGCALETQSGTVTNNLRRRFYWLPLLRRGGGGENFLGLVLSVYR